MWAGLWENQSPYFANIKLSSNTLLFDSNIITNIQLFSEEMMKPFESCSTKFSDKEILSPEKRGNLIMENQAESISITVEQDVENRWAQHQKKIMEWFQVRDIKMGYPQTIRHNFQDSQKLTYIHSDHKNHSENHGRFGVTRKPTLNSVKLMRKNTVAF